MATEVQLEPDDLPTRVPGEVHQPEPGPPVPEAKHGVLSNAPDDTWLSSMGKGAATALGKAAAGVIGMPGDIGRAIDYAITGARSYIEDKPHQLLIEESAKKGAELRAAGFPEPAPSSEDVYRTAADYLGAGEYKPTSDVGKYAMLGLEGGASMLMPFGVAGKGLKAGKEALAVGRGAPSAVWQGTKAVTPGVLAGAGMTTGAQGLQDITGSPMAGLAAIPLGVLGARGAGALYNTIASEPRAARDRLLDLGGSREHRASVLKGAEDVSPYGAPRTSAEAYFSGPLASKQVELLQSQNTSTPARMRMLGITEGQRAADEAAIAGLAAPGADPLAITGTAQRMRGDLEENVKRLNDAARTGADPVAAAETKRGLVSDNRKNVDKQIRELYESVDPEGLAQTELTNTRSAAKKIRDELDLDVSEMPPELESLLKRVENEKLSGIQPYKKALALDQTIEQARRRAKDAGEDNLARQIGQLKSGVLADLENVHLPESAAGAGLDPAARLREGKDLYMAALDTFENPYIGNALVPGKRGFAVAPEGIIDRIFPSGDKGKNGVEAWLKAAGDTPEALAQVQGIALDKLNKMRMKGDEVLPLTQNMLDKWINTYRGALGAVDGASNGFISQFRDAAKANTLLEQFSKSQAAKFLNVEDPSAVSSRIMSMIKGADGARNIRGLLDEIPVEARASVQEGLKRAAADGILNSFAREGGGINGASFAKYVRNNEDALKALYGNNYNNIRDVADEYARRQRVFSVGATHGSPTAYNQRAEIRAAEETPLDMAQTAIGVALLKQAVGPTAGNLLAARDFGRKIIDWVLRSRARSINDIMIDAIFDPEKLRALYKGEYSLPPTERNILTARPTLRGVQQSVQGAEAQQQESRAQGYAKGGRIGKINHAKIAAGLIHAAEMAKKQHSETTKPLLDQPDEAIVKALSVANEALG